MSLWKRRRLALVSNPNAGKRTPRAGLGAVIRSVMSLPGNPNKLYESATLAGLTDMAKRIQAEQPDILAVAGGDGTLHHTLTSVFREYEGQTEPWPQILILPIGTMNTVATSLGINRLPPVELARRIEEKMRTHADLDVVHAHVLKINGQYGFIYGAGLPVNFLRAYYGDGESKRGGWRAFKVGLGAIVSELPRFGLWSRFRRRLVEPFEASIRLSHVNPHWAPSLTHTGLFCSTVDQIGLGCRALPEAMRHPGKFMLRSFQLSFWGLIASLGQLWAGLPLPRTFDAVTDQAVIEYRQPTATMIDGEIYEPESRHVIECGPRLTFILG